ncbi:MAG TPA: hypothetical protein VF215_08695, partial [Thermoanaerobaculia bacterium]
MRSTLLAVVALLVPQMTFATPADDIAAKFVDVLRHDSLAQLANLVDEQEHDPHAWDELRDLVDRFDCTRIDRYDSTIESSTNERIALRVELEGRAELKAVWRPERRLSRIWHIEARRVDANWRVTRAFTEERRIAMAMVAARTPFDADRLFSASFDVDVPQVVRLYADELTRAGDLPRFEYARELARSSGDVATQVDVLRAHAAAMTADPVRMLAVCRDTERVARQSGNRDDLARALLTLGAAQWLNGDVEGARNSYAATVDMVDVLDDPTTAMKALQMIVFLNGTDVAPLKRMKSVEQQVE